MGPGTMRAESQGKDQEAHRRRARATEEHGSCHRETPAGGVPRALWVQRRDAFSFGMSPQCSGRVSVPCKIPGLSFGWFKHSRGNRPQALPLEGQPAMVHMGEHSHLPLVLLTPLLGEQRDPGRAKCRRLPRPAVLHKAPISLGSHEVQTAPTWGTQYLVQFAVTWEQHMGGDLPRAHKLRGVNKVGQLP